MKKTILIVLAFALLAALAACGADTPEASGEPSGPLPTPEPTEESTDATPELQFQTPRAGDYVVSSVGCQGDVTFYSTLDPANGFIRLEADGTGFLSFDGVEGELTWDEEAVYWGDVTAPCAYTSYYDEELEMEDTMLVVYFLEEQTSVVFRPAATGGEQ